MPVTSYAAYTIFFLAVMQRLQSVCSCCSKLIWRGLQTSQCYAEAPKVTVSFWSKDLYRIYLDMSHAISGTGLYTKCRLVLWLTCRRPQPLKLHMKKKAWMLVAILRQNELRLSCLSNLKYIDIWCQKHDLQSHVMYGNCANDCFFPLIFTSLKRGSTGHWY